MLERTHAQNTQTLLSSRIPRDTEHERYHPELEEELKECLFCLRRNEMMFDLEVDTDLIEQRIYERQALLCRFRFFLAVCLSAAFIYMDKQQILVLGEPLRSSSQKLTEEDAVFDRILQSLNLFDF